MEWDKYQDRRGQRKEWKYLRESCHYCIECSVPNKAMLFSLYNHSQRFWGGADGTSISTMNLNLHMDVGERKEASIKWGAEGNLKRDWVTTTTQDVLEKAPRIVPRINLF